MQTAVGESTYPVVGNFKWTKVYLSMVATPLSVASVLLAHLAYVLFRLATTCAVFLVVLALFGLLPGVAAAVAALLAAVLIGMVLVGVGTFFAQACATGFVGRAATTDRGSASGLYLACYFFGGLIGSAVLGVIFDMFGWAACVGGIAAALLVAALLAVFLKTPMTPQLARH